MRWNLSARHKALRGFVERQAWRETKQEAPMLDNPPLLTIHRGHRRPDRALIEAFRGAQTSHLADAMEGRGALDYRIKPMDPDNAVFVGPALTALAYPADVVGVYGALLEAEAGDVIVVANDAYSATAVIGGSTRHATKWRPQRLLRIRRASTTEGITEIDSCWRSWTSSRRT
jgi:hypothetical protein